MRCGVYLVLAVVAVITSLVLGGCNRPDNTRTERAKDAAAVGQGGLAPLVVDMEAPLLLEEPGGGENPFAAIATAAGEENTACFVCHANYQEEKLTTLHAAADVGCTRCHGKSYPHRNDENHTTAPDKMFGADEIRAFCRTCHPKGDPDKRDLEKKPCTDCHGSHRLKVRSVRWDKKTGELVPPGTAK